MIQIKNWNNNASRKPQHISSWLELIKHFWARQCIPLRGKWKGDAEKDSNFHLLLLVRAEEDLEVTSWLERNQHRYTSPAIQNEMLES